MIEIKRVSKGDYDVRDHGMPIYNELAWYATDDDLVLGVVILDKIDKNFSWVVLSEDIEDQGPGFTGVDLSHSIDDEDEATEQLHKAMQDQHEILRLKAR